MERVTERREICIDNLCGYIDLDGDYFWGMVENRNVLAKLAYNVMQRAEEGMDNVLYAVVHAPRDNLTGGITLHEFCIPLKEYENYHGKKTVIANDALHKITEAVKGQDQEYLKTFLSDYEPSSLKIFPRKSSPQYAREG